MGALVEEDSFASCVDAALLPLRELISDLDNAGNDHEFRLCCARKMIGAAGYLCEQLISALPVGARTVGKGEVDEGEGDEEEKGDE